MMSGVSFNTVTSAQARPGRAGRPAPGGPPRSRVAPSALGQLESARRYLAEAADEPAPAIRYVNAHLAALRAAAAVVAARGEPPTGGRAAPAPPQRVGAAAAGRADPGRVGRVLRGRGQQAGRGRGGPVPRGDPARGRRPAARR